MKHDLPVSGRLTIGRSAECDVRIDLPSVSRRHAILHVGPPLTVEDLGSSNGTRLSGHRLPPHGICALGAGATLELGHATIIIAGGEPIAPASMLPPDGTPRVTSPPDAPGALVEPTMDRLHRLVQMVAAARIGVILLGETGVGKEVMAEAIHRASPRSSQPLVRLNCAALPEALLEGELFGYERGAFTGAMTAKPGLLETADGGSVFLDEVTDLSPTTQAKLLRVIESREVLRLGALSPRKIDLRFISATNRDPEVLVSSGLFRRDLYYRLNGITITIPPLRDRTAEIGPLAEAFAMQASRQMGRAPLGITPHAMARLMRHAWPGNIRELRNVIERAVALSGQGPIDVPHLGLDLPASPVNALAPGVSITAEASVAGLRQEVEELEKRRIADALERSAGNQTTAAKLLGISRRTLLGRLDAYGLPRPRKGGKA